MAENETPEADKNTLDLLLIHGHVLAELMTHERFRTFITTNYEITFSERGVTVHEYSVDTSIEKLKEVVRRGEEARTGGIVTATPDQVAALSKR